MSSSESSSRTKESEKLELELDELDELELDELELEELDELGEVKFGSNRFSKLFSTGFPPMPGHIFLVGCGLRTVRITCGSLFSCVNSVGVRQIGQTDAWPALSCLFAVPWMQLGQ